MAIPIALITTLIPILQTIIHGIAKEIQAHKDAHAATTPDRPAAPVGTPVLDATMAELPQILELLKQIQDAQAEAKAAKEAGKAKPAA